VTNDQGANLLSGLVAALLPPASQSATAVLEVDEAALPTAIDMCRPTMIALLNLSRDQLDRFEEVASHVVRWGDALQRYSDVRVVANAADPLVVAAVRRARANDDLVTWVDAGSRWHGDSPLCPSCGNAWDVDRQPWACEVCGDGMPRATWTLVSERELRDATGTSRPLSLSMPGRAAAANATMAAATADLLGLPVEAALRQFCTVRDVDGRYQTTIVRGQPVRLLLAKNPAGWLEILDQLDATVGSLLVGVNARRADGLDPSWLWDVPFERIRGRRVIAFGDRSSDLSVRLHYADVEHDVADGVEQALELATVGPSCIAANYTAFVEARGALRLAPA
jgi:UDP-N-acetylmuramyl tripeptide synthase